MGKSFNIYRPIVLWLTWLLASSGWVMSLVACGTGGGSGDSGSSSGGALYGTTTISGSIAGATGGQNRMAGWVVVLTERLTRISRVGEVNASGIFSIKGVRPGESQTLTLLSPDYNVRGMFAVASSTSNKIQVFFRIQGSTLPRLIHRGYVVSPQSMDGLSLDSDLMNDSNGDGAPDGSSALGLSSLSDVDLDQDGAVNDTDPDIDGDGLLNVFDSDDDADGVEDLVDTDANGNLIVDSAESYGDQYFQDGVNFVAYSIEVRPQLDGSTKTYLIVSSKLRSGNAPLAVQVRGPASLLNGATIEATESAPAAAWDKQLLDDGASEDGFAGDGIYARKVLLASGRSVRPYQALFLQLVFGSTNDPVFAEFPFTFPDIDLGSMAFSFTAATRTVVKSPSSAPFGDVTAYNWSVIVNNSDGVKIYESPLTAGSSDSLVIPDKLLQSGESYTLQATAQLLDRIPGYPAFVVYSTESTVSF